MSQGQGPEPGAGALPAPMALVSFCVDGLRVGTLVELHGLDDVEMNGSLGQILSYSEHEGFGVMLITGKQVQMKAANIKVPADLKRPGQGGSATSFDLLVGPKMDESSLADEIAACLFEKGFCVMRICQSTDEVSQTFQAMREMAEAGKLQRFPEELEEGYLGANNRGKVAWLDPTDKDSPKDPLLDKNDAFLSKLAALVQPYCADMLGKQIDERTPALMSLSLTDEEEPEYPPADSDDAALGQFLSIWRRKLLHVVHFMGPESCNVTLDSTGAGALPSKQDAVEIEAEPNTILIFRPGCFNYECRTGEETLSLTCAFLEQTSQLTLFDWEGDPAFLFTGEGPPGPVGEQLEVVNMATRLMSNYDEAGAYNAGLYGACDSGVEIPFTRWDIEDYYNGDSDSLMPWQSPTKHQSMVEGVELFDNKYFEIILSEARVMDPMQRMVLETGAKNLFQMGITKKVSNRNPHHGGCSVGLDKDDWDRVPKCPEAEGGTNVQAIISNRFSFVFNLRGPNFVADTACSASLCATHLAKFTLLDRSIDKLEFHIAIGLHLCLHPSYFLGGKNNTMNSPIGRCLTFNATASGYMRGDGCSGITLKHGNHEERDAVWRASMINQNGRSATLTAPNGLAQGEIIEKAIVEAKITPPESVIWSCHGTGTSLGDPIEVGAVRRCQIKQERPTLLMVLTNKTHTGHLEGGAAMTSLVAATLMCKSLVGVPINHFRQLNPNLEQSSFDAFFNNEMGDTHYTCGNVHISSFGFGGSNGHCIMWGQSLFGIPDVPSALLKRLKKMAPPEVRVAGADPAEWEWDGPEKDIKPGDKYKIELDSTDAADAAIRWEKVADGADDGDGEDDVYYITGPFNEWDTDRMEEGPITGLRTITVEVPASGEIEFRFVKNGEEEEGCLFPAVDKCTRRTTPILGPDLPKQDRKKEKTTWLAQAEPNDLLKIDLFVCRGRKSVQWSSLGPEE
uniref:Type I polyketide synthase n=1 Tax=Gambierdiscus excentricus TaxID=986170 RepID=A0A1S6K862_9DINO|nr:type I polyketide synthase [Gambierdiscus excentricus]